MKRVHVAVGVILDAQQNILLTRRPEHAHQGGLWEFPGGKVEPGESLAVALSRELREELDIEPLRTSPLIAIRHDYDDKSVLLDVHVVWEFSGRPRALEGQPMDWVPVEALLEYDFPAANEPIIPALRALLP
ncbi:8-oxo-dGTP diphosphatase MutT [Seongchinamella unica]|uniref:8-oxo-dGTP diphosphatase n=1 Tax=Seongchinamella unica TaxID=2547392 RepID=A0A4R5LUN4_9GAMM|nr:8-oxo-dGTP diphosphatase MutT [Seongchinamella unica]TDG15071.1 8-oxo-dGTP diphosphatase MutT [Seongchinamella unica]